MDFSVFSEYATVDHHDMTRDMDSESRTILQFLTEIDKLTKIQEIKQRIDSSFYLPFKEISKKEITIDKMLINGKEIASKSYKGFKLVESHRKLQAKGQEELEKFGRQFAVKNLIKPHICTVPIIGYSKTVDESHKTTFILYSVNRKLKCLENISDRLIDVPIGKRVGWIGHICQALHFFHNSGFAYKYLSPERVFINESNDLAFLEDYGVGIEVRVRENHSHPPAFLDMQINNWQITGANDPTNSLETQKKNDIFSIGLLMYYLITLEKLQESRKESLNHHFKKGFFMEAIKKCIFSGGTSIGVESLFQIIFTVMKKYNESNEPDPRKRFTYAYEDSVWDLILDWKNIKITLNK